MNCYDQTHILYVGAWGRVDIHEKFKFLKRSVGSWTLGDTRTHKFLSNNVCIYLMLLPWVQCNTSSIFKWSTSGLNTKLSFSQTGCLIKIKEPSLPYCFPIAGGGDEEQMDQCFCSGKSLKMKRKRLHPVFELESPILFFMMIIITLSALQSNCIDSLWN